MGLINKDELLKHKRTVWDMRDQKLYAVPVGVIMNFPEEEHVRHGTWEPGESYDHDGWMRCSRCHTSFNSDDLYSVGEKNWSELPNYCPHCGACMRGEDG